MSKAFKRHFESGRGGHHHLLIADPNYSPAFSFKSKGVYNVLPFLGWGSMRSTVYFNHNLAVKQYKVGNKVVAEKWMLGAVSLTKPFNLLL